MPFTPRMSKSNKNNKLAISVIAPVCFICFIFTLPSLAHASCSPNGSVHTLPNGNVSIGYTCTGGQTVNFTPTTSAANQCGAAGGSCSAFKQQIKTFMNRAKNAPNISALANSVQAGISNGDPNASLTVAHNSVGQITGITCGNGLGITIQPSSGSVTNSQPSTQQPLPPTTSCGSAIVLPSTIHQGQTAYIIDSFSNASTITIKNLTLASSTTYNNPNSFFHPVKVSPPVTSQYAISITGPYASGSVSCNFVLRPHFNPSTGQVTSVPQNTLTVIPNVNASGPTITAFYAQPSTILSGDSTTLHWQAQNATACYATPTSAPPGFSTGPSQPTQGQATTQTLTTNTNFSLTCRDAAGHKAQLSTPVRVLPPNVTIGANPDQVKSGGSVSISWNATNVKSCSISRNGIPWPGYQNMKANASHGVSGTANDTVTAQTVYKIVCDKNTASSATVSATKVVNVTGVYKNY